MKFDTLQRNDQKGDEVKEEQLWFALLGLLFAPVNKTEKNKDIFFGYFFV